MCVCARAPARSQRADAAAADGECEADGVCALGMTGPRRAGGGGGQHCGGGRDPGGGRAHRVRQAAGHVPSESRPTRVTSHPSHVPPESRPIRVSFHPSHVPSESYPIRVTSHPSHVSSVSYLMARRACGATRPPRLARSGSTRPRCQPAAPGRARRRAAASRRRAGDRPRRLQSIAEQTGSASGRLSVAERWECSRNEVTWSQ